MVGYKDIPRDMLIEKIADVLKTKVKEPEWAIVVKTGQHKERGPYETDWYYKRLASVLRKIAILGPIGSIRLSAEYGGKVDRGSKRYHASTGSRKIIRQCMYDLEKLGYVTKSEKGREISPEGLKFLNSIAKELSEKLKEDVPEISKYL
jgi:Ribosomal protein S19E (S16A)